MNEIFIKGSSLFNVDNEDEAKCIIQNGGRKFTPQEIAAAGMSGYENLVSPDNTVIDVNGRIIFTPPEPEPLETAKVRFERLRAERDRRLVATDYLLMPDYPIDDTLKGAVQAYRQALRDLPSQEGAPWDGGGEATPWPEIPSVLQEQQGSSTSSVYTPGVM